jgi:hypothetical protein
MASSSSSSVTDERQEGSGVLTTMPEAVPSTGALSYRIPIEVPPGRLGIAPNLALTYNSQARNSWVGIGWTLDLGSIQANTRFGAKYDQFVAAINGSTSELVPDASLGAGCYRTKIEGAFSKYCYDANNKYWTVYTKDGTKYYYGQTEDGSSRQVDPAITTHIFRWCLDKVEDANGNYMTISYTKDTTVANNSELYPSQILYAMTDALTYTTEVNFGLENRPDMPEMYTPNFKAVIGKRLSQIDVKVKKDGTPTLVRSYVLAYNGGVATGSPEPTTLAHPCPTEP